MLTENLRKVVARWVRGVLDPDRLGGIFKRLPYLRKLGREVAAVSPALEDLDHEEFEDEVLENETPPHFPEFKQSDLGHDAAFAYMIDVNLKVGLEPRFLRTLLVKKTVRAGIIHKPSGYHIDVKIAADVGELVTPEAESGCFSLKLVRLGERARSAFVDLLQRRAGRLVIAIEIAREIQIVRLL